MLNNGVNLTLESYENLDLVFFSFARMNFLFLQKRNDVWKHDI